MPTTALYHWSVAGSPVNLLLDLPLVDRLRIACSQPAAEVGGILIGTFDGNYTVITDFELVDSEHRRGTAYALTSRDEMRLGGRIEARSKRHRGEVVGFFRSHLRPGLFLDEADHQIIASHFNDQRQAALLVKPASDGSATGGFFFWEEGEMNRKQTYLPFPMSSRDLETGDFPLVEPVAETGLAPNAAHFDTAETVDQLSAAALLARAPGQSAAGHRPETQDRTADTTAATARIAPSARKWNWPVVALIAASAALGGYIVGTSGSHDRFGSRPGDLTVGADGDQQAPQTAQHPAPAPVTPSQPTSSTPPAAAPSSVSPAETPRPSPMPVKEAALPAPATKTAPVISSTALPPQEPPRIAQPQTQTATAPIAIPAVQTPAPPVTPQAAPGWSHFGSNNPPAAPSYEPPSAAPRPAPAVAPAAQTGDGSVYLESVQDGGFRQALHRIPLIGRSRSGDDFVPPQALRSFAPKIPADLARALTATEPVDLKLKVDSTGRVTSVELLSRGTPPDFVRLAGDAAYDWQFQPARLKDKAVSSEVIAHFRFHPVY